MKRYSNKRINIISIMLFVVIVIAFCCLSDSFKGSVNKLFGLPGPSVSTEGSVEMHVIDVGQGDSVLIKSEKSALLIDAGPNSSQNKLVSYLRAQGIEKLDCLVLTHPHEDHIGGADLVLESFITDTVLMPDFPASTKAFENLLDAIEARSLNITIPRRGDKFVLDNINYTVLSPSENDYEETNDYSIGLKIEFGETSFVLTGDAEKLSEGEMLDYFGADFLDCDIFKAAHHGSTTSNSKKFIKALSPDYIAISCGLDNTYGHPHKEIRDLFEEISAKVYRTDLDSDIVFVSDGKEISVK